MRRTSERILRSEVTTAAQVSSHEVSIPRAISGRGGSEQWRVENVEVEEEEEEIGGNDERDRFGGKRAMEPDAQRRRTMRISREIMGWDGVIEEE